MRQYILVDKNKKRTCTKDNSCCRNVNNNKLKVVFLMNFVIVTFVLPVIFTVTSGRFRYAKGEFLSQPGKKDARYHGLAYRWIKENHWYAAEGVAEWMPSCHQCQSKQHINSITDKKKQQQEDYYLQKFAEIHLRILIEVNFPENLVKLIFGNNLSRFLLKNIIYAPVKTV